MLNSHSKWISWWQVWFYLFTRGQYFRFSSIFSLAFQKARLYHLHLPLGNNKLLFSHVSVRPLSGRHTWMYYPWPSCRFVGLLAICKGHQDKTQRYDRRSPLSL